MNSLVSTLLCAALIWLPTGSAHAAQLGLTVVEKNKESFNYTFDSTTFKFREAAFAGKQPIELSQDYTAQNGKLLKQGTPLSDLLEVLHVVEVLYQCQVDGVDLVVVKTFKNSMSSPLKVLSAMSGHPIQKYTVVALRIDGTKVLARREIVGRDSSYHWQATMFRLEDAGAVREPDAQQVK